MLHLITTKSRSANWGIAAPWVSGLQRALSLLLFMSILLLPCGHSQIAQASDDPSEPIEKSLPFSFEAQVNNYQPSTQSRACLGVDDKMGTMTVVWESRRQEKGTYGIVARQFDPWGRAISEELRVNETVIGSQVEPAIAVDSRARNTWIVWESKASPHSSTRIMRRRFAVQDGALAATGGEIHVNLLENGALVADPSIAIHPQEHVGLITWVEQSADSSATTQVRGRLFDTQSGALQGDVLYISNPVDESDRLPSVAACSEGQFLIAWDRIDASGDPKGILVRLLQTDGTMDDEPQWVTPSDSQFVNIEPSLAIGGQDRSSCTITWMSKAPGEHTYAVMARSWDVESQQWDQPIVVADAVEGEWQSGAAVAYSSDGRQFIVSYNVQGQSSQTSVDDIETQFAHVRARAFAANGTPLGPTFQINQSNQGTQALAAGSNATRLIWSAQHGLAAVWEGEVQADHHGIGLTVLSSQEPTLPSPARLASQFAGEELSVADVRGIPSIPERDDQWIPRQREISPAGTGPDFGFVGFARTEWRPPDPDVSVGPDHIIATVNMRIAIFDKAGNELLNQYLEEFFSEVNADYFFVDPVTQYDHLADRFIVVSGEHEGGVKEKSRLLVAVSKTSNPMNGWHFYRFNLEQHGDYFDFENLGIGEEAYFVTSDYFDSRGSRLHIMEKAPMLMGDPVSLDVHSITSSKSIGLGPIDVREADGSAAYFVTAFSGLRTRLQLYAVVNPITAPVISNYMLPVEWMNLPPDAAQKGTTRLLPTLDFRTKHGVYRHGSMWVTQTVGGHSNTTAQIRWYEIAMEGWPTSGKLPFVKQWGTIDLGPGEHNWFADIGVDADRDVTIVANRSSVSEFPFVSRFVHKATDPPGSTRAEVILKESFDPYLGSRWGDYGSIAEDPDEPGVFWSHHEYVGGAGTDWRTWIARIDTEQSLVLQATRMKRGKWSQCTITNAAFDQEVFLVYSLQGLGSTKIPSKAITLDLRQPKLLDHGFTDVSGERTFSFRVPDDAPLGDIWFQAAEFHNTSNVIETNIQE